jgi:hypothetical protein
VLAPVTLQAETRAWLDDSVTHAYLGGSLQYARGPVQLWGSLGHWVSGGLDRVAWSAGAGAAIAPGVELQLGGHGNAFDPLYLSATETSFWAGLSLRVGGGRAFAAPVPARARDGRAVIAIPARSVRGTPSIAGDFTGWKPVPMQRDGSRWTCGEARAGRVPLRLRRRGRHLVRAWSVRGRQDDGMGGQVAVLVVP